MKARLPLLLLSVVPAAAFSQLTIDNSLTPEQLVQNVLLGSGVAISNVTFNGAPGTSLNLQAAAFDGSACNVGMAAGVLLSTGDGVAALGPNNAGGMTLGSPGGTGDADLTALSGVATFDQAVLEFDFVPNGDTLRFNYVFGSEEYAEYVCTQYNDVFGFFLSGPGISGPFSGGAENIALVPSTTLPVSISTINNGNPGMPGCGPTNVAYFIDNGDGFTAPMNIDSTYIQYDGFTVVLEAFALVQCGLTYHIKLALADGSDPVLDSGVFLEAGSFTSTAAVTASLSTVVGLIDSTLYEGCASAILGFTRYAGFNTIDTVQVSVGGTATMGVDFSPIIPPEIVFQVGDTTIWFVLTAPVDPDLFETVTLTISNVAQCSGMLVVTDFTFYINEAQPMYITVADTAIGCDDWVTIGPTVYEGYGNYGYIWSNGATTPTITVSPPVTTTYTVTVTDTCGIIPQSGNITITVPVFPPVTITVSNDTAIPCLSGATLAVLASGGDGVYTYTWTNGSGTVLGTASTLAVTSGPPATYYIDVQAGCGMGAQDSVVVTPLALPPVVVTTNNDTTVVCPGDPVDLQVLSTTGGNGVYTYSWTDPAGVEISTGTTVTVNVNDTTQYTIQVDDQCGNSGADLINVYTPQYAPYQLTVANDTAICLGQGMTLWALPTGGAGNYTFHWSNPTSSMSTIGIVPDTTDVYSVSVTDQCGSTLSGTVVVDVQDVTASFIINYTDEYDVTFFNTSQGNHTIYEWQFGDGDMATTMHTGHHYIDTDDHYVWLTIWNAIGCVDSVSVMVQPPAHLYVPNAFTPDGDGLNDQFGPVGHDIYEFEMLIFDRWGEVIFSTTDPARSWDGKVNGSGEIAKNGVYVYKVRASGRRFGPVEYIGSVALVK